MVVFVRCNRTNSSGKLKVENRRFSGNPSATDYPHVGLTAEKTTGRRAPTHLLMRYAAG